MSAEVSNSILLITNGDNAVRRWLNASNYNTEVIDCAMTSRESVLTASLASTAGLIITYRCPYILPYDSYGHRRYGGINIHPTLLPAYPGINPWDDMKKANETQGGVTIHRLSDKVDRGKILAQKTMPLDFSKGKYDRMRNEADTLALVMLQEYLSKLYDNGVMA